MQSDASSSSLDDLLPSESNDYGDDNGREDDRGFTLVESELLNVFDSCRRISISGTRSSSIRRNNSGTNRIKERIPASEEDHSYPCKDETHSSCQYPPEKWPQRPIMLTPSPESGMTILGVRYSSSKTYLPLPGTGYCNGCILPINNGLEKQGESLVIDFESRLFVGTLMLRIKNACNPLESQRESGESVDSDVAEKDNPSYFHNKKRTFHGVVRGRFKLPGIPMAECVTGQVFNQPAGMLPPRIIVKGAISVIGRLAPQLQARLDGNCPRFLSPLVSTTQHAMSCQLDDAADYKGADEGIEAEMSEPQPSDPSSLIQDLPTSTSSIPPDSDNNKTRIKIRKKAFDKLYSKRTKTPTFDPNSEYTFSFFQHMVLFDEFALNFVRPIGKHPLSGMLNGQPLKFMAAHQIQERSVNKQIVDEEMRWLWSFDLWHETLYEDE